MRERADKLMVAQGLAGSRQRAQALIMAGDVFAGERRIAKPGQLLDPGEELRLRERLAYVSRGGLKLEAALRGFGVAVADRVALDLGASTGGFTDCLLQNGAARVYAVDVDPRQLDWSLQNDPRVTPIKKNARYLIPDDLPSPVDLAVMDLSFISVLKVLPALPTLLADGPVIALIKPQFEVGRGLVGRKGIVRNPDLHRQVLLQVADGAEALGFGLAGCLPSPILGQKGNREFLVLWVRGPSPVGAQEREIWIKESVAHEND